MNGLVFVMYNCKLNERQIKKYSEALLDEDEVQVVQDEDEDVEDDVGVVGGEVDDVMSVDSDEGGNPIDNKDGNDDNDIGNGDDDGDDDGESGGDEEDNCDVYEEWTNFGLD
ncbi:hypothetical protein O6P43_023021 [Quillaja saponaria]|uniref:Uncharacterized protein n=1 Tax=Quillaja saponaria TaxID=32244 RepID=A0AAD7PI88_QUISA|nr:hypothetical protein O6P43_023021 [Quillaja saponaria]